MTYLELVSLAAAQKSRINNNKAAFKHHLSHTQTIWSRVMPDDYVIQVLLDQILLL